MRNLPACPILAFALFAAGFSSPATAQIQIHLPEEERPPILEQIGAPEGLTTLTIAPGGDRAAAALIAETEQVRSTVLLYSTDSAEPASLELAGRIRDLLFAPDSQSVLGLLHKPAKKREGDTYLVRIELSPPRARRVMRLPPSARSLDFWPERNALLVASRNEIRTLTLPELRSGPLYRVNGENLAVASLGSCGLILVGQEAGLLLLDLDAPPGEAGMPVRERVSSPQNVLSLAASADGSRALARLADGEVHVVELRPLRLAATGTPGSVAAAEKAAAPEPGEIAADAPPEQRIEVAEQPEPVTPPAEPAPEAVPEAGPSVAAAVEAQPAETREPAPESAEPVVETASPEPRAVRATTHQVRGRIGGPAAGEVLAVLFLGPDNVLREALRVVPGDDGEWSADGLAPGRYRVQLDGGGGRVIVSQPPFLLLEIEAGESTDADEIQALQAL